MSRPRTPDVRRPGRRARRPRASARPAPPERLEPRSLLSGAVISEFLASNSGGLRDADGDRSDWIELHNPSDAPADLGGWTLTDDAADPGKWALPAGVVLPPGGFLLVFASDKDRTDPAGELHANFRLGADGEYLGLFRPDGTPADQFAPAFPPQEADRSYGIAFDPDTLRAQVGTRVAPDAPTPGAPNVAAARGVVGAVSASVPRGFYDEPFLVTLGTPTEGAVIRFTVDGSEPTADHGHVYVAPLSVAGTVVVRAAAFRGDDLAQPPGAWTYIFPDDVLRQSPDGRAPFGWPATWGDHVVDYGMDPRIVNHPRFGGPRLAAALKAIPTISLTTDLANLFDPATGIYANSPQEGREWERPVSVELIHPDGTPGFQANAGLRLRGTSSAATTNPKHSLRLFFRDEYGAPTLEYPLFGDEGASSFARVDLRTDQSFSWGFKGDPRSTFVAEVFARDTMRDLGRPYTRSRHYHLYINGQYWGLYQTEERPDANFGATYFGGDPDDYDVIRPENGLQIGATDGDLDAWHRLWRGATAPGGLADDAAYYRLQGRNPDGSPNPSYENLLDVGSLIDYMLVILYTGNTDGPIIRTPGGVVINNFYAIRDRTGDHGFQFIMRDAEYTLMDPGVNVNGPFLDHIEFALFNPHFLHTKLLANDDYRRRFGDRARELLTGDGALTPRASLDRLLARVREIDPAILGESARWGDAQRPGDPLTYRHWRQAVNRVVRGFLPYRSAVVQNQFRALGLLPSPRPPRPPWWPPAARTG